MVRSHRPGSDKFGLTLEFAGDHHRHVIDFPDDVYATWENDSLNLTIDFSYDSLNVAEHLYWELQRIIPELRKDKR